MATITTSWVLLAAGDVGASIAVPDRMSLTPITALVQASGTVTTLVIQGSLDGVNWNTLNDSTGTAIASLGANIKKLNEIPPYIRPLLSAGSGVTVTLVIR
jgi:hypothetical protein